jgi:ABC-type phosphate transport system auxiliary subunit
LFVQVRVIFESAHADIDLWAQATVQVLQTELIERERSLAKRMASVSGVQGSSSDAGAQIAELDAQLEAIKLQGRRLVAISKGIEGEANAVAQQNLGV